MHRLPLVDVKTPLISFVSNTISDSSAEHHLVAPHVIVHDVLQVRHQIFLVDEIKVYKLVSRDLDPDITFHEIYKAPLFDRVVELPFKYLGHLIPYLFEEQDAAGASGDEGLAIDKHHLAKFFVSYNFMPEVCQI